MSEEQKVTEYTVQMAAPMIGILDDGHGNEAAGAKTEAWQDIATVEVPAGSKVKTIIGRALAESGVKPEVGGEPLRLRALDVRSARVTVVSAKAVDPELEMS
jgi:hypothetical protein